MWKVYGIMFLVVVVIAIFWVRGIDNMMKNHPDYKGEDFFGDGFNFDDKKEDEEDKKDYDEE
jgi:hypothetical protein